MQTSDEQFKKLILDSRLVTEAEYAEAEKKSKEKKQKVGDILLSDGKISESDLRRIEAFALGIPFVSLAKIS